MSNLNLSPNPKAFRKRKRVGRGIGSNYGKTCGKGMNGQRSRSGAKIPLWFEGGQNPLYRRVPKRGFTNIFKKKYYIVNLLHLFEMKHKLESIDEINLDTLVQLNLTPDQKLPVKLLAKLECLGNEKALDYTFLSNKKFKLHFASKASIKKLEEVGASIELVDFKLDRTKKIDKKKDQVKSTYTRKGDKVKVSHSKQNEKKEVLVSK